LQQWIGQGRPIAWPAAHSPDLNPLDCYVWWHLTSPFYATELSDLHDMQQQIENGLDMICTIWIFLQFRHSLFRSAMSCTEAQGVSFKHYLQPSGGHNSETTLQKAYAYIALFFSYCDADSPSVKFGCALFFNPVYTPD
jgi:hypothetical protein